MSSNQKSDWSVLEVHIIRRQQVQQTLVLASVLALLLSGCTAKDSSANLEEKISAVFYENTAQCEADAKQQQQEYQVLLAAYQKKELDNYPVAPKLKPEDCQAQMLAAQQAHEKNAPVYETLADCEAEGVRCEDTPSGYHTVGYRPIFGGSYFYPYDNYGGFTYINLGGTNRRVYEPRTVYQSVTPGEVVTPHGKTVTKTSPGRTTVPRYTTIAAPQRPSGVAARGTIKGRSSSGFGSTYKSTGKGGK